jgi:ketosteroid isomerase-like protein
MATAILFEQTERELVTRDERRIRDTIAALHRAHLTHDAQAATALYTEDAEVFNLAPPLIHQGVNVEEKQAWMDSWATPIEIVPHDLKITVGGDFAFARCLLQMSGTKKGAEGAVRFWMRGTMEFERIRGSWRIVHEHTSVPFYMDGSFRPAFDLQPEPRSEGEAA